MSLVPLYLGIRAADSFAGASMTIAAPNLGSFGHSEGKQASWRESVGSLRQSGQDKTVSTVPVLHLSLCPRSCPCPYVRTDCGKQAPILRTVPV
jgi:hypothetical protein